MWNKAAPNRPSSQAADAPIVSRNAMQSPAQPVALPAPAVPSPAAEPRGAAAAVGESAIASHLKIAGEITGNSDLCIDGEVRGKIRMAGARVTVGAKGRIHADMEARELIIHGRVEGSLYATERLHLGASSWVQGKVLAPRIRIDDGANLHGAVETMAAGVTPKPVAAIPKASVVIGAGVPAATEHQEIIP